MSESQTRRRSDRGRSRRESPQQMEVDSWVPRTRAGQLVKEGTITDISEYFLNNWSIDEPEIVTTLVPNLSEKVLDVSRVQRQTDAGRRTLFVATAAVGNQNGLIGLGQGKAAGVGTAIRSAINHAKINLVPVKRGCGSWECTCGKPHSLPFRVKGKVSSVTVVLYPAPKGLGLVIGDAAKAVLRLAGIEDVWSRAHGETRTTPNFCKATFEALKETYEIVHPTERVLYSE